MGKKIIYFMLFLVMLSCVNAMGVSRQYLKDNTLYIDANETVDFKFQLQNMESSQKRMTFKIVSQSPFQIEGGNFYEHQFTLNSKTTQDIIVEFMSSSEGKFKVEYSYVDDSDTGSGIGISMNARDSFFVQVGDDTTYYGLGMQLIYGKYTLRTSSTSIRTVDDLFVDGITTDIDFSGRTTDMTGFNESYIDVGQAYAYINSVAMPSLNKRARITMTGIPANYKIMKDGSQCPLSVCSFVSYSAGSKRLVFDVTGFSRYEVVEVAAPPVVTPSTTTSGGSSGGGGIIPKNTTQKQNATQPIIEKPVEKPIVNTSVTEQPVVNKVDIKPQEQPKNDSSGLGKIVTTIEDAIKGKTLLISIVILALILVILSIWLLFYYRNNVLGEKK